MDFILKNSLSTPDWVFVVSLFVLCYITFVRVQFGKNLSLIYLSTISRKYSNQFFRESNNQASTYIILPIFIFVFSLLMTHPVLQQGSEWDSSIFFNFVLLASLYLVLKYFILHIVAILFETKYLFEEINYHSFLFEKVGGIFLFPLVLLSIYSPFSSKIMFQIALAFFFLIFVFKCIRIIYLSFFKSSFSKTHIIVYLCTLEILPLLLFINKIS